MARPVAAALLLVLALAAPGCGHRGAPRPPLPRVPERPREVHWRQRGDRLEVSAEFRLLALTGRPLHPPIAPVVLWVAARSPGEADTWRSRLRAGEFRRSAAEVRLDPFPPARAGERLSARRECPVEAFGVAKVVVLALAVRDRRTRSFPSPRVVWAPLRPGLAAPGSFTATPEEEGIRLRWEPPGDPRARFADVYRAVGPDAPFPPSPWRRAPAGDGELVDREARYGQVVRYELALAAEAPGIPVESPALAAGPVDYRDVFPPRPPRDVDVVPEPGGIRVLWRPGGSRDERRVEVWRQAEGDERWVRAGDVDVPGATFLDEGLDPARRYRYRLVAVDGAGNRSEAAGPTRWERPREERR